MPTYLVHGFRWQRASIRIHIILQDLEDAAAEWIVAPATSITLLNSFYSMYDFLPPSNPPTKPPPPIPPTAIERPGPAYEYGDMRPKTANKETKNGNEDMRPKTANKESTKGLKSSRSMLNLRRKSSATALKSNGYGARPGTSGRGNESQERPKTSATYLSVDTRRIDKRQGFNEWSTIKLLEQYDPNDLTAVSQPYAYVADYIVEVGLSASLAQEILNYEAKTRREEMMVTPPVPPVPPVPPLPPLPGTPTTTGDLPSPILSARDQRRRSRRLGWIEKLRDGLQKDSEIGWFVVVCGDEERAIPSMDSSRSHFDFGSDSDVSERPKTATLKGFFQRKRTVPDVRDVYR